MAALTFEEALGEVAEYLGHARRFLGQYVEELEGMAEGAGVSLAALGVPNCGEEFTCRAPWS